MTCPKCRATVPDQSAFCMACGARLGPGMTPRDGNGSGALAPPTPAAPPAPPPGTKQAYSLAFGPLVDERLRYRVARCRHCGLTFQNPRPTPQTLGLLYTDDYKPYQPRRVRAGAPSLRERLVRIVLARRFNYPAVRASWPERLLAGLLAFRLRPSPDSQTSLPFVGQGRLLGRIVLPAPGADAGGIGGRRQLRRRGFSHGAAAAGSCARRS